MVGFPKGRQGQSPQTFYEETEEEFYEEEALKDFSTDRIPQPLLGWLLKGWAMEYFKEDVEFEESYEHLFENFIL